MPYTIAEKILLAHTGKNDIKPGEFIEAKVDLALGNDITAPLAIAEFKKAGFNRVFNNKKVVLVPDHFAPAKDLKSANQCKVLADFAREQKIENYFEVGCMGIEHALLPEMGLVLTVKFVYKGKLKKWVGGKDLILYTIGQIGVDGAIYKVMEFSGSVIRNLSMDERFTMSNMAIEAGGVTGIIEPDEVTGDYVRSVRRTAYSVRRYKERTKDLNSDAGAKYEKVYEWDVSKLEPQVACPHLPSNSKPVSQLKNIKINQVVIGSCTNGRISDLRVAAKILKGRKAQSRVRLIVIPATQKIYAQAVSEGLAEIFVKAGGVFSTPTCGPCLGGHLGVLTEGERCIATTNRNFIGRMGSPKSEVYLSSPAVAAASAVKGRIVHPEEA
jgi:3-isopropylmalate/(R)-2-methylmalate dehydratase large subunit